MLIIIFRLLSLGGLATGVVADDVPEVVASPRVAQVRLAETLAGADAIHSVTARGGMITFAITRGDQSFQVAARTAPRSTARSDKGEILSLTITPAASSASAIELGGLSWLGDELESVTAITHLVPDDDGAVTITTDDGRRYMAIPGRGSGGNAAVEARWAAEWNG
jgi:hypothetical protein